MCGRGVARFLSASIRLLANLIPFSFYALFTTDQVTDQVAILDLVKKFKVYPQNTVSWFTPRMVDDIINHS